MSLLRIRKTSGWKFQTSATGGLGVGFFVASGGGIALIDPKSKDEDHPTWLHYAGAGVGGSVGLRKIPKVGPAIDTKGLSEKGSGNLAPASFWNHGIVYVMNGCSGDDLQLTDFKGPCCFVDVGAGLVVGYAGFGLLMNISEEAISSLSEPVIGPMLFETKADPHALLLSRGWNLGPQANAGISISNGYVW